MTRPDSVLPRGWALAKIVDTGQYINGFAFKPEHWESKGRLIIRIQNLTDSGREYNRTTFAAPESIHVEPGEILVSWSATLDAFIWSGEPALLNQHIFRVIPEERLVTSRFLFYLLKYAIARMIQSEHLHGSTMRHINRGPFMAFPTAIPPKNEQARIVDEIEKQFTRLDAAVVALKRAKANLKRYRAAMLKAAFEGELTSSLRTQVSSSENSDFSLLEEIQAERKAKWERGPFRPPAPMRTTELVSIPSSWTWQPFDTFVTDSFYGPRFGENEYSEKGVPTIRTTDIEFGGTIVLKDPPRIDLKKEDLRKFSLRDGDLLVTRTGATIGKCALYWENIGPAIPSAYLIRFRLTRASVPPRYLLLFLMSPRGQEMLLRRSTAVAQPNVNATTIAQFAVPLPPKAEIAEMIRKADELLDAAEATEKNLAAAESKIQSFRQSILLRAFEGKLVPQDPNDEPASALLARIRSECGVKSTSIRPKGRKREVAVP